MRNGSKGSETGWEPRKEPFSGNEDEMSPRYSGELRWRTSPVGCSVILSVSIR